MTYQSNQPPYGGWPSQPPAPAPPPRRHLATVALIVVPILVFAAVFAGVFLFWDRDDASKDAGSPVEGQLRGTYPTMPAAGWRLAADKVFDGAVFVRPDPTSTQYSRPGFIDLGNTLITQAVLPQTDRGYDLVAIDAKSGRIRWQTTIDSGAQSMSGLDVSPAACASKVVDGLLPCVVEGDRAILQHGGRLGRAPTRGAGKSVDRRGARLGRVHPRLPDDGQRLDDRSDRVLEPDLLQ